MLEAVQSVAGELDATPAQVALRWLIDQWAFTCVPVFGAQTVEQLEENVAAVEVDLSGGQYDRSGDAFERESRPRRA